MEKEGQQGPEGSSEGNCCSGITDGGERLFLLYCTCNTRLGRVLVLETFLAFGTVLNDIQMGNVTVTVQIDARYELEKHLQIETALFCRLEAFQVLDFIALDNILLIHLTFRLFCLAILALAFCIILCTPSTLS